MKTKKIEISCGDGVKVKVDGQPVEASFENGKWYCTVGEEKPALGARPCWLVAESRIQELSEAILRQLEAENTKYDLIKQWATEIEEQCNLIDYFGED